MVCFGVPYAGQRVQARVVIVVSGCAYLEYCISHGVRILAVFCVAEMFGRRVARYSASATPRVFFVSGDYSQVTSAMHDLPRNSTQDDFGAKLFPLGAAGDTFCSAIAYSLSSSTIWLRKNTARVSLPMKAPGLAPHNGAWGGGGAQLAHAFLLEMEGFWPPY